MRIHVANPIEVPEDVRVEDAPLADTGKLPPLDAVPEDTHGELDREARLADADLELRLTEGQPPADSDADV
jgi:hypothetical protein